MKQALEERREGPVELRHARRGDKRRIYELAERNARLALEQDKLAHPAPPPAARRRAQRPARGARRWTRCRSGSSASTSPTSARPTRSPRWSCSRAARRRSPTTGASRSAASTAARTTSPRWRRCCRGGWRSSGAQRELLAPRRLPTTRASRRCPALIVIDGGKGQLSSGLAVAAGVRGRGRRGRQPRQAARGGVPAGPQAADRAARPTRSRSSFSSACATRRTASRSSTTGCAATAR